MKASVWAERGGKKAGMCPSPGGLQLLYPLDVLEGCNRQVCDDKACFVKNKLIKKILTGRVVCHIGRNV